MKRKKPSRSTKRKTGFRVKRIVLLITFAVVGIVVAGLALYSNWYRQHGDVLGQSSSIQRSTYDNWYKQYGTRRMGSSNADILGWHEGPIINSLLSMYQATNDTKYLDDAKKHIDADLATAKYNPTLKYYGWETTKYSAGGKSYPYFVLDGFLLHGIARYVRVVKSYKVTSHVASADSYLNRLERDFVGQWEHTWREFSGNRGVYTVPSGWQGWNPDTTNFPYGSSMPHNMYLIYGSFLHELYKVTDKPQYKDKVVKMANAFRTSLRTNGNRYEWNYMEIVLPSDPPGRFIKLEDASHGNLDIDFAIDLYQSGLVFKEDDIKKFTRTFINMYKGEAGLAPFVTGNSHATNPTMTTNYYKNYYAWARLAAVDSRADSAVRGLLTSAHTMNATSPYYGYAVANILRNDAPATLTCGGTTHNSIKLRWRTANTSRARIVRESPAGTVGGTLAPVGSATREDTGLASNTSYTYKLRNNSDTGKVLATVQCKTKAASSGSSSPSQSPSLDADGQPDVSQSTESIGSAQSSNKSDSPQGLSGVLNAVKAKADTVSQTVSDTYRASPIHGKIALILLIGVTMAGTGAGCYYAGAYVWNHKIRK